MAAKAIANAKEAKALIEAALGDAMNEQLQLDEDHDRPWSDEFAYDFFIDGEMVLNADMLDLIPDHYEKFKKALASFLGKRGESEAFGPITETGELELKGVTGDYSNTLMGTASSVSFGPNETFDTPLKWLLRFLSFLRLRQEMGPGNNVDFTAYFAEADASLAVMDP